MEEDPDLRKRLFTHYYTYKNTIFGAVPRASCEIGILCSVLFYISFSNPWQGVILGILGVVLLILLRAIQECSVQIAKEVEKEENDFLKERKDKIELEKKQKSYQKKGFMYSRVWLLKILVLSFVVLLSGLASGLARSNGDESPWLESLTLCLLFSIQINDLASCLPSILDSKREASYFWFHFVRANGK